MRIRLADEDRERLGGPEWLESYFDRLTTQDAEVIEEGTGYTVREFLGELRSDNPTTKFLRARVWFGLHRAGVNLPFSECHFDLFGTTIDAENPGKARSATSGSSTRGRSASATRSKSSPRKR